MEIMIRFQVIGLKFEIERLQKDIVPLRQKIDMIGKNPNQQVQAVAARRLLVVIERDLGEFEQAISTLGDVSESDILAQEDDIQQTGEKVIRVEEALKEIVTFCEKVNRDELLSAEIEPIQGSKSREISKTPTSHIRKVVSPSIKSAHTIQTIKNAAVSFPNIKDRTEAADGNLDKEVGDKQNQDRQSQKSNIQKELEAIKALPIDTNTKIPRNSYWKSLIEIASLAKKGYMGNEEALVAIKKASSHLRLLDSDIEYQWNLAYKRVDLSSVAPNFVVRADLKSQN